MRDELEQNKHACEDFPPETGFCEVEDVIEVCLEDVIEISFNHLKNNK